jgi:hypothetical protein
MNFIQFYVRLDNKELDREFDLEIDSVINQTEIPMTFEETILMIVKEGKEEGKRALQKVVSNATLPSLQTFSAKRNSPKKK